ncbi:hypothetical protein H8B09_10705 [Paenibacillus sp. PR3]|uniref:Uncharacterized protein n=1 Tax=Paenibacillus terricola TaxID=2763503 RepID=A0ABR8MTC4_9BACL|nr:hypothetical protein [Paenibacillus terricola]MBD3919223.1 hypothetical protein [Paenibacillus terricola]
MNSSFTIELRASYALNYLIYVQNAVLNKRETGSERNSKFPYLNCDDWHLTDDNFEHVFTEVWEDMLGKIALNPQSDHNGVGETERKVYLRLFKPDREGELGFVESWQSFNAWFGGYWGHYAIESLIDNTLINEMYTKLRPHFQSNKLSILVLYDEPTFIHKELKALQHVNVVSFHQLRHAFDQTIERIIRG